MASLSDDTLRKILVQIQQTAVQSQRALNVAVQQTNAKDRERRILQLTIDEIGQMKGDVNLYKGVGKMFMNVPRTTMEAELKAQEKELSDDITNLTKSLNFWRSNIMMPKLNYETSSTTPQSNNEVDTHACMILDTYAITTESSGFSLRRSA